MTSFHGVGVKPAKFQQDWSSVATMSRKALSPSTFLSNIVRLCIALVLLLVSHVILASSSAGGYSPLVMLVGWFLCGTALFALSCTAQACATGAFSSSNTANRLFGWLSTAPLLLPYEHWAARAQKARRAETLTWLASSTWLWWLASWVEWADASTSCRSGGGGGAPNTSKTTQSRALLQSIANDTKNTEHSTPAKPQAEFDHGLDCDERMTGRAQEECTGMTNVLLLYGLAVGSIWLTSKKFGAAGALLAVGKYFIIPWAIYHMWRSVAISITLSKEVVSLRVAILEGSQAVMAAKALKAAWSDAGIPSSRHSQTDFVETAIGRLADLRLDLLGQHVGSRRRALLIALFGDSAVTPEWLWHPSAQVNTLLRIARGFSHLPAADCTLHGCDSVETNDNHPSIPGAQKSELKINWFNTIMISAIHAGAFYGIVGCAPSASGKTYALTFALYQLSGLGITAGAHRLWAHKSYSAHVSVRAVLSIFNAMAYQGSIYEWARHHRVHHKFSDTEADPHDSTRGFWYSHVGWILREPPPAVVRAARNAKVKDLEADPIVMWQHKHYPLLALLSCFALPAAIAGWGWGEAWAGLWLGGCFRLVWVWHMTWLVNSAAHAFGNRPYLSSIKPVQNWLVSVGAMGEGWHNYHHAYPHDYSANEHGWTGEWNPTTFVIDSLAALGLVWGRTKANAHPVDRSQLPRWTPTDLARQIETETMQAKEEGRAARLLLVFDDPASQSSRSPKQLVVDAAPFIDAHPGGTAVIKSLIGRNASKAFNAVKHTQEAQHMLYSLQVAELLPTFVGKELATIAEVADPDVPAKLKNV